MIGIKGFDMPKNCGECYFSGYYHEFGSSYTCCNLDKEVGEKMHKCLRDLLDLEADERPYNCPLVELKGEQ